MIIITGPTAAGKTDFAIELASQIPSEIINMDMGQMYAPLSIGTAKPDWNSSLIQHHMFDIIKTPDNYTVVEYRKALLELIGDLKERKKIPIVVGGSLFYLKSLFFPPDQHVAQQQEHTIVQHDYQNKSTQMLWDELYAIDPIRASSVKKSDRYRIERALSLWRTTGKKPSECLLSYISPTPSYIILYVTRDRKELYHRIDQRVIAMMEQGWLDEVKNFIETPWQFFIQNKKIIGYNELVQFLTSSTKSEPDYQAVVNSIQQRSRRYAKRQDTFWRGLKRDLESCSRYHDSDQKPFIQEVNLSNTNQSEYIKAIIKKL